jgi:zinc transport system ATP-binding protein
MMATQPKTLLSCAALRVGYGGRAILPPIDLAIGPGEFWVVLGRNGSGKTTLFRTLLGLQAPISGTVSRGAHDLRFAYVPQRTAFDPLVPMLAREVVRQGCERGLSVLAPRVARPPIVRSSLEEVHAWDLAERSFRSLSEGQKQRVLLARLIASEAHLALLDEPTAAMDAVAEREAFGYLDELRRKRATTIVVVSHYLGVAHAYADHAVFLDNEASEVVVGEPGEVVCHPAFRLRYSSVGESLAEELACDE